MKVVSGVSGKVLWPGCFYNPLRHSLDLCGVESVLFFNERVKKFRSLGWNIGLKPTV